jgi:hypothetical protein
VIKNIYKEDRNLFMTSDAAENEIKISEDERKFKISPLDELFLYCHQSIFGFLFEPFRLKKHENYEKIIEVGE